MNNDVQAGVITYRGSYKNNNWLMLQLYRGLRKKNKGKPGSKNGLLKEGGVLYVVYFITASWEDLCS